MDSLATILIDRASEIHRFIWLSFLNALAKTSFSFSISSRHETQSRPIPLMLATCSEWIWPAVPIESGHPVGAKRHWCFSILPMFQLSSSFCFFLMDPPLSWIRWATDLTFYDRQKCVLEEHFISSPKTLLRIIPADKDETAGNDNEVLSLESVQDTWWWIPRWCSRGVYSAKVLLLVFCRTFKSPPRKIHFCLDFSLSFHHNVINL